MATSLQKTSEQPSFTGYSSIATPKARIISHDLNSLSEAVSLSFKTVEEAKQFLGTYESAFSDFATLKQSRWVGKPVVLISLKTRENLSPSVVDITDALTKIFTDIDFQKSSSQEVRSPTCQSNLPTPEIGLVRRTNNLSLAPDVAYLYFKVRGYAQQFLASHAGKFADFAIAKSVRRSNTTVRISLKPDVPASIKNITDVLERIFPGVKILDIATLRPHLGQPTQG